MTDNALIAEFMGVITNKEGTHTSMHFGNKKLIYDTSWDWLMPVVEKIAKHEYERWQDSNGWKEVTHIETAYPRTFGMLDNEGKWMVRINRMHLECEDTLIKATYQAVVEFIKLYNENKKS